MIHFKAQLVPILTLAVAFFTLMAAVWGLYIAYSASDIASQQLKDIGSWLKVRVIDFQYVKPGEDKLCGPQRFKDLTDTEGCFFIEVQNRLDEEARNIRFDHKVPPEDWLSDWRLKEDIAEPGKVFSLPRLGKQVFVLYRSIAQDPINYYCQKDNNLKLFIDIAWQDAEHVAYEMTRMFKADCIKTTRGEIKFKWTPLSEVPRG